MAAWRGHKDAVQLLINAGASVNELNKKHNTLLMCAAQSNKSSVVNFLLETLEEVDVNAVDLSGQSALYLAAANGFAQIVKRLIEFGASHDLRNKVRTINLLWKVKSILISPWILGYC